MREITLTALIVGLTGLLLYRINPHFQQFNVAAGDRAPKVDLVLEDGSGLRLSDYGGKHVLLHFWATWCPPCIQEIPSLNKLYERFRDRGLVVLGISVDHDETAYNRFLEKVGVRFPTVRDPQRKISTRYGVYKYPETFLIDPEGTVVRRFIGSQNWQRPEIVNYLASLLN